MLAGALAPVARAALVEGEAGADRRSSSGRSRRSSRCWPTRRTASTPRCAIWACASLEFKLDGARIQVHKAGDEVRVYSRNLRDVSAAVPESGRGGAALAGARDHPRRRGDRAARRRHAASVSGHDAPVRPQARRRRACAGRCPSTRSSSTASTSTANPLIDEPLARRIDVLARHSAPGSLLVAPHRDRRRRRSVGVPRARARRRPRRRDGEGDWTASTRPAGAARRG